MSASEEPVRWGLLSTAAINDKFLAGARAAAGAEVLAVASRDRQRAERYAAERDIPRVHGSYAALLEDGEIDAVYISLPNALHVPWTLSALRAGKHVLCEKPLSRRAAEVEEACALAAERGLCLSEGFMYRHHPQTLRLAELVAEGRIGELRTVRAHFSFPARSPQDVRLSVALDGGALMDVGCYCVSGARLFAGEPEAVSAQQTLGGDGVDVRFTATLRFPGDVLAHFDAGMDCAHRHELELVGAESTLLVRDPWHGRVPGIEWRRDGESEAIAVEAADPYEREAENFCAAVRGRAPLRLGPADALAQARALEALYTAAGSGRTVSVTPPTEAVAG